MSYNKFKDISVKGSDLISGFSFDVQGNVHLGNNLVVDGSFTMKGNSTAITQAAGTNTTQLATCQFVQSAIPSLSGYATLGGAQIWTGNFNTFSYPPQCAVAPTTGNMLCNKTYVDSQIGTSSILASTNTFTSQNTFSNFAPLCSTAPATANNLVNKQYADGLITTLAAASTSWTGVNSFNTSLPTSTLPSTTTVTNQSILNKAIMDAIYPSYTYAATNYGRLASPNDWTSTNTFNTSLPTSTLPSTTTVTNQSILNKAIMDAIYPSYTYAAANYGRLASPNSWSMDNTFSAGQVTFSGNVPLCSTAPTSINHLTNKSYVDGATVATGNAIKVSTALSTTYYPALVTGSGSSLSVYEDISLSYTQSTTTLNCTNFNGTASIANAVKITAASAATYYPTLVTGVGVSLPLYEDTGLSYTQSTNTLTCTNFAGTATTSINIKVSAATSTTYYPTLVTASGASIAVYEDTNLSYTPNNLTCTNFLGTATNSINAVLAYASASSLNLTATNGTTGNKQLNVHAGLRMDATGSLDLSCNGNFSAGGSCSVGNNLMVGANAGIGGTASVGGGLYVSGASTFNDFVYMNGGFSANGQLIGFSYDSGYWHVTNTYNFRIGKSQNNLTAVFGSTVNVSILLGNYGTGYIQVNPFYKAILVGADGSVLFVADNTYATDVKLFLVTYKNPNLTAAAGLQIFYLGNLI